METSQVLGVAMGRRTGAARWMHLKPLRAEMLLVPISTVPWGWGGFLSPS